MCCVKHLSSKVYFRPIQGNGQRSRIRWSLLNNAPCDDLNTQNSKFLVPIVDSVIEIVGGTLK